MKQINEIYMAYLIGEYEKIRRKYRSDGGAGSGNFNHEGREGQVGGSAPKGADPVPFGGKSEKTRELIAQRKGNVMGFGMSGDEKAAARKELVEQLKSDGAKVSYDEEYDIYRVMDTGMSYKENREVAEYVNFGHRLGAPGREEYIKACEDDGVEPQLHVNKDRIGDASLKKTDGTDVYWQLSTDQLLTNSEILEYSGHDAEVSPSNAKKFSETTDSVISKLSPDEAGALTSYTSQYGVNYQRVNEYLNGSNPDDSAAQKNAELITKALDHEVGAPVIACRGEHDLSHITDDPKVQKMLGKVSRGDFSQASKLKEALEGQEVTNSTVTSTSIGSFGEGYDKLPVQIVYKVPAKAKGADITQVSKYGGARGEAASIFGGSASYESELALKPGTSYKIERVEFGVKQNGKKQLNQIFIVASVNWSATE